MDLEMVFLIFFLGVDGGDKYEELFLFNSIKPKAALYSSLPIVEVSISFIFLFLSCAFFFVPPFFPIFPLFPLFTLLFFFYS